MLDQKYFRHHGCLLQITFCSISQLKYGSWSWEQYCSSSLWSDQHKREGERFPSSFLTVRSCCLIKRTLILQLTQIWTSTIRDSLLWVYTLLLLTYRHNWAGHSGGRCCWSLPTHSEWALGTFLEAELRGKSMRALVERVERGRKRERIRWLGKLSYYYYYELLTSDLAWWGHWAPLSLVLFMLCLTEAPLSMSFFLSGSQSLCLSTHHQCEAQRGEATYSRSPREQ